MDNTRSGFTIIEILVAVGIMAGIMFMIGVFGIRVSDLGRFASSRLSSRADLEYAFALMTTEIRSAGPSSLGAYPIVQAAAASFSFYSDIDKDGLFELVRYFLAASANATTSFMKGVITPSGNPLTYNPANEVVKEVIPNAIPTAVVFTYFDETYTGVEPPLPEPVDPLAVRVVKAELTADLNPGVAPQPAIFKTKVNLRNLRSN
jgi:hypothetical protein